MEQVPAALRELLVGGAEGNAFFLEQLIKVAIEAGVISKGEDDLVGGCGPAWRPAGAADAERVLQANGDPHAASVLDTAHELLQERAARIENDGLRRSFLENVEANRRIVKEWTARGE